MKPTESQFIRDRCLAMIRSAAMHEERWEWTLLDRMHEQVAKQITLGDDEHAIVSFYVGPEDWTLLTTHRMIGVTGAVRTEIGRSEYGATDFGDFKQDVDSPRITPARITLGRAGTATFLYESGYASMAPIHYFKFWQLKWPVWQKTYELLK